MLHNCLCSCSWLLIKAAYFHTKPTSSESVRLFLGNLLQDLWGRLTTAGAATCWKSFIALTCFGFFHCVHFVLDSRRLCSAFESMCILSDHKRWWSIWFNQTCLILSVFSLKDRPWSFLNSKTTEKSYNVGPWLFKCESVQFKRSSRIKGVWKSLNGSISIVYNIIKMEFKKREKSPN